MRRTFNLDLKLSPAHTLVGGSSIVVGQSKFIIEFVTAHDYYSSQVIMREVALH